jgi:hypothetical protein
MALLTIDEALGHLFRHRETAAHYDHALRHAPRGSEARDEARRRLLETSLSARRIESDICCALRDRGHTYVVHFGEVLIAENHRLRAIGSIASPGEVHVALCDGDLDPLVADDQADMRGEDWHAAIPNLAT